MANYFFAGQRMSCWYPSPKLWSLASNSKVSKEGRYWSCHNSPLGFRCSNTWNGSTTSWWQSTVELSLFPSSPNIYHVVKDVLFYIFGYPQQKQDESLLEDVWTLLRAGRVEEACELCRSAGQVCISLRLLDHNFFHCARLKFASWCDSHGGLQLYVHLEGWTNSPPLKLWWRTGRIKLCKPLNWKVVLVANGVFGNGLHTVPRR